MVKTLQGFKIEPVSNPAEHRHDMETAGARGVITSYLTPLEPWNLVKPSYAPCDPVSGGPWLVVSSKIEISQILICRISFR